MSSKLGDVQVCNQKKLLWQFKTHPFVLSVSWESPLTSWWNNWSTQLPKWSNQAPLGSHWKLPLLNGVPMWQQSIPSPWNWLVPTHLEHFLSTKIMTDIIPSSLLPPSELPSPYLVKTCCMYSHNENEVEKHLFLRSIKLKWFKIIYSTVLDRSEKLWIVGFLVHFKELSMVYESLTDGYGGKKSIPHRLLDPLICRLPSIKLPWFA